MRRFERHVGASPIRLYETCTRPHPSSEDIQDGYFILSTGRLWRERVLKDGRVLASSVMEVRAVWPSPSCAELAGLKLQRFRLSLRFLGMLLSPLAFTERRAGVQRHLPRILADCVGASLVRDTAHFSPISDRSTPLVVQLSNTWDNSRSPTTPCFGSFGLPSLG